MKKLFHNDDKISLDWIELKNSRDKEEFFDFEDFDTSSFIKFRGKNSKWEYLMVGSPSFKEYWQFDTRKNEWKAKKFPGSLWDIRHAFYPEYDFLPCS